MDRVSSEHSSLERPRPQSGTYNRIDSVEGINALIRHGFDTMDKIQIEQIDETTKNANMRYLSQKTEGGRRADQQIGEVAVAFNPYKRKNIGSTQHNKSSLIEKANAAAAAINAQKVSQSANLSRQKRASSSLSKGGKSSKRSNGQGTSLLMKYATS